MNLLGENTLWIFISGSDEERFIDDIRFGLDILQDKNISLENIKVFIDGEKNIIESSFANAELIPKIFSIKSLENELRKKPYKNVILFTTGHGDENGLQGEQALPSFKLIEFVRSIPGLQSGLLVIGQCYAGVFHYMDAETTPKLCIIGSTGFEVSLSLESNSIVNTLKKIASTQGNEQVFLPHGLKIKNWKANIFLFFFFIWLHEPKDIDGNNELTVMDAYKFASIRTNMILCDQKCQTTFFIQESINSYNEFFKALSKIYPSVEEYPDETNSLFREHLQLNVSSEKQRIDKQLQVLYTQHEPFVLNSRLAQELKFDIAD
jgi:hypothetical protein